jgi:uncharacterized protein (UPF0276 family)
LDLPWGAPIGFERDPEAGDRIAPRVLRYLERHIDDFNYVFVSWQPRNRNQLNIADYIDVWDELFEKMPPWSVRALHQTAFNLGSLEPYDTTELVAFTNGLIERYNLAWVNEDLGLWSLHGRPLPYPLPPYLTDAGLEASIRNTAAIQESLSAPLLVEFPGFSDGTSFFMGTWHGYDFFKRVVEDTGSPATLDTGHLLSYQWLQGKRGDALYDELDRLPLEHCFEIHLSGCQIVSERFMDYHHGIIMDEQLVILERLLELCPNVRAVTYEDPKFSPEGVETKRSVHNFERLREMTRAWAA